METLTFQTFGTPLNKMKHPTPTPPVFRIVLLHTEASDQRLFRRSVYEFFKCSTTYENTLEAKYAKY